MRSLRKVLRFVKIYGLRKTLYKVAGRSRHHSRLFRPRPKQERNIGVIGCGQFTFSTVGYALVKQIGNRFTDCYDIDSAAMMSFAQFYGIGAPSPSSTDVISNKAVRLVYIASNHASHTNYATSALEAGKTVYLEKPISVDHRQLKQLLTIVHKAESDIYAGYNRPFSSAIRKLGNICRDVSGPLTLGCFISGHVLQADHWYRNPEEGTRICGNVGHWLDLAVHMLSWGELPDLWRITLACSNETARDEDLSISLTSDRGDLVNIVLTARSEPFEGINETINFQKGNVIAKIDDFRKMVVWNDDTCKKWRFWPKDVGHNLAIVQPFSDTKREWHEIELSTLLMLFIKDMVIEGKSIAAFSFADEWEKLGVN